MSAKCHKQTSRRLPRTSIIAWRRERKAWSLAFLLLPPCCVYYPVSVLPDWLQLVALAPPTTHVCADALQRAGTLVQLGE